MGALERAERDIERGDYGLARLRLVSYLSTQGYDPDLLARLGRIAYDMHDPFAAGMYWLTSTAEGPEVEEAIAAFRRRSGHTPTQIVSQLPRMLRMAGIHAYPKIVQDRLFRLGLDEAILFTPGPPRDAPVAKWKERGCLAVALLVLVAGITVFIVGLGVVSIWLFGN